MVTSPVRVIEWLPLWNRKQEGGGIEHLVLSAGRGYGVVLAPDEEHGLLRFTYHLRWDESWQLYEAELDSVTDRARRSMTLRTDGRGHWQDGEGRALTELDGCRDIDLWPTPFTNSFPIRRLAMKVGERREILVAWINAFDLIVRPQRQAYTRLAERRYRFESLDGSGFEAELDVDADGIVEDYPGLFRRVKMKS